MSTLHERIEYLEEGTKRTILVISAVTRPDTATTLCNDIKQAESIAVQRASISGVPSIVVQYGPGSAKRIVSLVIPSDVEFHESRVTVIPRGGR